MKDRPFVKRKYILIKDDGINQLFGWHIPDCWECGQKMEIVHLTTSVTLAVTAVCRFECLNVLEHYDYRLNYIVFNNTDLVDRVTCGWVREARGSYSEGSY